MTSSETVQYEQEKGQAGFKEETGRRPSRRSRRIPGTHAAGNGVQLLSRVQLFATPWTVAHQVPLSVGFPRQECWSGLPFLSPGGLPNPGIHLGSPALAGRFFTAELPGKLHTAVSPFQTHTTLPGPGYRGTAQIYINQLNGAYFSFQVSPLIYTLKQSFQSILLILLI